MIQHNDAKATKTKYEEFLLRHHMPRQFWSHVVSQPVFNHFSISKTIEGKPKPVELFQSSPALQTQYWNNLLSVISNWSPSGADAPEEFCALFCSENVRTAQFMAFTAMHYMMIKQFDKKTRSYKAEVHRIYELYKLLQMEDAMDIPSVVVVPQVLPNIPPQQISAMSELLTSSFRMFIATTMTPQKFFEMFGYIPSHIFYVDTLKVAPIRSLFKGA